MCGAACARPRGLAQSAPPRGWGLCTFTSARPAPGDPRTCGGLGGLRFGLFCPGGRIEVQAEGSAPGPATGQVLPPAGLTVLCLLLCSPFIHYRCEVPLGSLSWTRDLFAGPLCTPALVSWPWKARTQTKGSAPLAEASFSCSDCGVSALGCCLRPPGMNHFTCYASPLPNDL